MRAHDAQPGLRGHRAASNAHVNSCAASAVAVP
jgi:hypothetical protein